MASFSLVAMLCNPFELEVNFEFFNSHFDPVKFTPKHVPKPNNENDTPGSIEWWYGLLFVIAETVQSSRCILALV